MLYQHDIFNYDISNWGYIMAMNRMTVMNWQGRGRWMPILDFEIYTFASLDENSEWGRPLSGQIFGPSIFLEGTTGVAHSTPIFCHTVDIRNCSQWQMLEVRWPLHPSDMWFYMHFREMKPCLAYDSLLKHLYYFKNQMSSLSKGASRGFDVQIWIPQRDRYFFSSLPPLCAMTNLLCNGCGRQKRDGEWEA